MNEQDFQSKLGELLTRINDLPEPERVRLERLAEETRDRHERMKTAVGELQESLDYLRLSVKYLVFDLEATRRENKYLRSLIQGATEDHEQGE
ncbi:MAG: hypothetical protein ACF8R7_12650 [Phycisphaerales bacterium JB039]